MNIEGVDSRQDGTWVVELEHLLVQVHRQLLIAAVDPARDVGAGLTFAAVGLRDLLDEVRASEPFSSGVRNRVGHTHVPLDDSDLSSSVRSATDLIGETVRHQLELDLDELHLVRRCTHHLREIEGLVVRGCS